MMKILLVACNAKYIHSNLAVYDLKSYAEEYEKQVVLKEYTINQPKDDILRDIYLEAPDVLCVSCYIWNITFVKELMRDLAKILPDTVFWAGGPEVSFDAETFLVENPHFTGVMLGEGEETFRELAGYYVENITKLTEIKGIVFRNNGEIHNNGWREIMDLSRVPFVYKDLEDFQNRIIYYESSRGCPFACSYCLSSVDKKLRFRDLKLVKRELQFFIDNKVPQVKFVDRTFNCKHDHAVSIWKYIKEHDNGITNFHFEISADMLNGEELAILGKMRPGLVQLEIGVQSTNPKTLKEVRRFADLDKLRHAVVRIHAEHNIHVHLDLIAGLPYEDMDSFVRSFNDVYAMRPEQLQLGFLKVLKGSYMEEMASEYGLVYRKCPPYEVLYTKWLSYDDVIRLKKVEEMVELYYNSGQFTHILPVLVRRFGSAFEMYDRLALFYQEKGYFVNSPARSRRYEVLLEFAEQEDAERIGLYRELAVYDMYLRENAKSRPAFASDQRSYYDRIAGFYREEEGNRAYLPDYGEYQAKQLQRMTHLEIFEWPVDKTAWELWEMSTEEKRQEETALLFDYRRRDPMYGNAAVMRVEL